VVFTASVNAVAPGSGTPTGTVTFKDGATALSTNTLISGAVSYTNGNVPVAATSIRRCTTATQFSTPSTKLAGLTQTVKQGQQQCDVEFLDQTGGVSARP